MDKELICPVCGKTFIREGKKHTQKYCSIDCGRFAELNRKKNFYKNNKDEENRKRKERKKTKMINKSIVTSKKLSISEVVALANKKGMTYGKYVEKYKV